MTKLFSALMVKGMELKNRIVMPPMASSMATAAGAVTEKHFDYYLSRAGVGLIIVEHSFIHPAGRHKPNQLAVNDDSFVPGLRQLAGRILQAGPQVALQLAHAGGNSAVSPDPVGPSAVPHPVSGRTPRELSQAELAELLSAYRAAARRTVEAGFTAVEIHGAHGYLLNQFLSPLTNKRQDEYGGSLENRLRFPLEVVTAVREEVGPQYPVLYRLGADDRMEGGFTLEEAREIAPRLVEAGVDILDVSGGLCGGRPEGEPPGYFAPLAAGIKEVVSVPVILTGGITEPVLAEELLQEGKGDLIGIGRALLAEPRWPELAREELEG